jgi:hypothetical protein
MQPVEGAVETDRLRALTLYGVLDTARDKTFDRIARMAARCFAAPMATVSIVDTDRIWFKAAYGLHGVKQIGRDPGLCASAILDDVPYLVCDALADPRASNNPLVHGTLGIRFYAGAPIVTADGHRWEPSTCWTPARINLPMTKSQCSLIWPPPSWISWNYGGRQPRRRRRGRTQHSTGRSQRCRTRPRCRST